MIKLGRANNSELSTYYHVPVAIVPLKSVGEQYEDYCKREVNNALYNALYGYPVFNLIENGDLALVKNERELQKTEDFIDGAVIEQFKASGAMYIITLTDYVRSDKVVSLKLNVLNVEDGSVEKSLIISCPIDSIEDEMNLAIRKIIISPSAIVEVAGKHLIAYSTFPLATESGERFTLLYNKPIKNPVDGMLSYSRIAVASGRLVEWRGQEYVLSIDSILEKDEFKNIGNTNNTGLYYLQNSEN